VLWLEGKWRSPVHFDVLKVGKPIPDTELSASLYAEVETLQNEV
jgi:hypothetical protein